jgi:hypothetical protein
MEDVVDAGAWRKSQPDSDLVDELDDAVWSEEAQPELANRGLGQGGEATPSPPPDS